MNDGNLIYKWKNGCKSHLERLLELYENEIPYNTKKDAYVCVATGMYNSYRDASSTFDMVAFISWKELV